MVKDTDLESGCLVFGSGSMHISFVPWSSNWVQCLTLERVWTLALRVEYNNVNYLVTNTENYQYSY
jgi:hypothetical protein